MPLPCQAPRPNVEITAVLLLDAIGTPKDDFTLVAAVGRSAGWLAHAMEQRTTERMIRPAPAVVGSPISVADEKFIAFSCPVVA